MNNEQLKKSSMKIIDIEDTLATRGLHFDTISLKCNVCTVRRGFFYTHGVTAEQLASAVEKANPRFKVIDSGEVWKPFRGGASTANSSHWFVKFTIR